jgi:cytochrome c oxidase subunit IV
MVAFSLGWDLSFVLLVEDRGIVRLELRSRVLLLRLDATVEDIEVFVKGWRELELLRLGRCSAVEESLVLLELISEGLFVLELLVKTSLFVYLLMVESLIHLAQNISILQPLVLLVFLLLLGDYSHFEMGLRA